MRAQKTDTMSNAEVDERAPLLAQERARCEFKLYEKINA